MVCLLIFVDFIWAITFIFFHGRRFRNEILLLQEVSVSDAAGIWLTCNSLACWKKRQDRYSFLWPYSFIGENTTFGITINLLTELARIHAYKVSDRKDHQDSWGLHIVLYWMAAGNTIYHVWDEEKTANGQNPPPWSDKLVTSMTDLADIHYLE